jgi:hypothetical protein
MLSVAEFSLRNQPSDTRAPGQGSAPVRTVRVCYFNPAWADGLESAASFLERMPAFELRSRLADPGDASLLRKARLDCDWYAENARCLAGMTDSSLEFLPPWVCGRAGLLEFARAWREAAEERWLITMAHQPQALGELAGRAFALLRRAGVRILFYAFDEASRFMPCFRDVAPHVDVLIHDELPLHPAGEAALRPECLRILRSWVANVVPFAAPFNPAPEPKIVFLGSQPGLTAHRERQIAFLRDRFNERFIAIHDHSIPVGDRFSLNRYAVSLCPEGRKFTTPAMARTHTDRPFWSGCLGLVPVSEDSNSGGRLDELAEAGLILRYPHGDLEALAACCEQALAASTELRRRIYDHFNRQETVGTVVAGAITRAG